MTLFKQLALIISFFMTTILIAVFTINLQATKTSVTEALYEDAKNTASSLSLSLGTANGDEDIMSTMIDANFDSGHYTNISLYDINNTLIYERNSEILTNVPNWFLNLIHIEIPYASAQVSSGWSPIGILTVESDSGYAYAQLFDTFQNFLLLFSGLAVVGLLLIAFFLRLVLKSLDNVKNQATAILDNEFIILKDIPKTIEFKEIVLTMNATVKKVQEIFEKANEALARNQELLYKDPTTHLYNRRYLMLNIENLTKEDNENDGGAIMLAAFKGAEILNKTLGRQKTDQLFLEVANIFQEYTKEYDQRIIARINGTEFTLLLPNAKTSASKNIAEQLTSSIKATINNLNIDTKKVGVNIGVCRYTKDMKISTIFTKADYALSQTNLYPIGNAQLFEAKNSVAMGKEEWRGKIEDAIEQDYFALTFWPVYNDNSKKVVQKVMTFSMQDDESNNFAYGNFIAPAITLRLIDDIYIHILEKLFQSSHVEIAKKECSIRIPPEFMKISNSYIDMEELFKTYASNSKMQLTFEISNNIVLQNIELVRSYVALFKQFGFRFGINSFNGASGDYSYLKLLNPNFIKADSAFLLDQTKESMMAIQVVTEALGIEVIATGVKTQEEFSSLKELDIYTIQGPLAESLQ